MAAKIVLPAVPESLADVALVSKQHICAAGQFSPSHLDELVRKRIAPPPVIRRLRFVRWRLEDVRQFLIEYSTGTGDDAAAVAERKAADAAKVADVQAKRLATRLANQKAKDAARVEARRAHRQRASAGQDGGAEGLVGGVQ